jgi:hypothetical protein
MQTLRTTRPVTNPVNPTFWRVMDSCSRLNAYARDCQMVYFQTKNPTLGKFLEGLAVEDVCIIFAHLVYRVRKKNETFIRFIAFKNFSQNPVD